ncbi:CusA/CzcA family heavy metal efflux RND transporter [Xanthomonas cucurbitae]|uniref:CusA/CzcA family heavy metal efflux RND transporter n=1 Tax=Xanthomonas cucurbitae TaxID=56453 RepID=A0A2S7DWN6_9XANT|nr:CusA/CzcA family heavy metal efflux RND transporter [Xanthomonas cucurbitae]PPU78190.1 CusA/CzcA family heavy metal efflux RND transporter [Xanthomonas cucurbitae]WDM78142.1 CusA/CzcA family heavy metal efflux RND transporter [Xanthomonas cucurbitae]WDM81822.1 CusA/CzcA family heavy metal efflux RND transporter [Xanthomonas cucurbitae]
MIDAIVSTCFQRRGIAWLIFVFVALYGAWSWKQLPVEAYPDIADVTSQIVTQVPGLGAEEVEQQITIPLERVLLGTPGMHVLRSRSLFALSLITVVFEDGTDGYFARQRLQERLNEVSLPYGAMPGLDPYTSPTGEIFRYTLESTSRSLRELSELQFWTVIPRIRKAPGVVDVSNFGGVTTQFMLELEPERLRQYDLSLQNVKDAINANNANGGGSVVDRGEQSYVVRGVGLLRSLEDMGNVVVKTKNGLPVLVKDLGTLTYGNVERRGVLGKDDNPDTIEGITLLLKDYNTSQALAGIHEAVHDLNENLLPKDVKVVPYLDRTSLIDATLHTVSFTLAEGMVLVSLVLLLFLGSPRAAAIVALTIPLSLLIAFVFMHHFKIPANLLSLGAIDFGILVDGAVVLVENILRKREENEDRPLQAQDAIQATLQVARPIFFGMAVIVCAYLPLFAFQRIEYKLFSPMAYAVGAALAGALIVALTLIPALAWLAFRKPRKVFHNPVIDALSLRYAGFLERTLGKTRWLLVTCVTAVFGLIVLFSTIGRDFLPYLDEGSLWLQVQMPPGITLDKASAMANALRRVTLRFPEVSYMVTQTGRNDDGTDYWTPSHIEVSIGLHPYKEWKSGLTKQQLIAKLAERYAQMPGYTIGFMQPMIDGVQDKLSGAHSDLTVKVFGDDLTEVRGIANRLAGVLKRVPGSADVAVDVEPPLPNLKIELDRAAAARHGINAADVADLIATGIGGTPIGHLYVGEKSYDMTVRFPEKYRFSPDVIGNLTLKAPTGERVPLSDVARISTVSGESVIVREMAQRNIIVRLNVRDRDLASFLSDAHAAVARNVQFDHKRIQIKWGGQFENLERAEARLALILPMTLGIMFLLLFGEFRNLHQPLLVLVAVPLAMLGGLAALHLRGMTLNVSSAVGFIALFGVAVLNGVLMIAQINRLRHEEGKCLRDAVLEGARSRMRPVLMTATVAALGLTPAMLATGLGSDVQRPLATVVVGGLLTATALTLVLLPALYHLIEDRIARRNARTAALIASEQGAQR